MKSRTRSLSLLIAWLVVAPFAVVFPVHQASAVPYANPGNPSSVVGSVWFDVNGNGIRDGWEPAMWQQPSTTVDLIAENVPGHNQGDVIATQTNVYTNYAFTDVTPGTYRVKFTAPAGWSFGPANQGADDTIDSDVAATGLTEIINVPAETQEGNWDAGMYQSLAPAIIGDRVWNDSDYDYRQGDPSVEPGVPGVTVQLRDCAQPNVPNIATTVTDANGNYSFTAPPGLYQLHVTAPGRLFVLKGNNQGSPVDAVDSDINPANGDSDCMVFAGGQTNNNIDAGTYIPSTATGFIWNDLNGNGIQDPGEPGFANLDVTLNKWPYQPGNTSFTVHTDANGVYTNNNVPPGKWTVGSPTPAGGPWAYAKVDQGNDDTKDADGLSGSPAFTVTGGDTVDFDWGYSLASAVVGRVWHDLDGDGTQDPGEPGIGSDVNGLNGPTAQIIDCATNQPYPYQGSTIPQPVSPDGNYVFWYIPTGDYRVTFANLQPGYAFTLANQGSDATDSDADPSTGQTACVHVAPGAVGRLDAGLTGPQPSGATISGRSWFDANWNGVNESDPFNVAPEREYNGIHTVLLAENVPGHNPGDQLAETWTGSAGSNSYQFTNLAPGTYRVKFDGFPAGMQATLKDQGGDDNIDSDPDPATGLTDIITITSVFGVDHVDVGFTNPVNIGDKVWRDDAANGLQPAPQFGSAPSLPNVTVDLINCADNSVIDSTTSDSNEPGNYLFSGLRPGNYRLRFHKPDNSWFFSPQHAGSDSTLDSDPDPTTGETACQDYLANPSASSTYPDVDAALYQLATVHGVLFDDLNVSGIREPGEPGLAGASVELLDQNTSAVIASTTTDANGDYTFGPRPPGGYRVQFHLPAGYSWWTTQNTDPAVIGSDADHNSGQAFAFAGSGATVDISAGALTAGSASDRVWDDTNKNGIQDPGEPGLDNVDVRIYTCKYNDGGGGEAGGSLAAVGVLTQAVGSPARCLPGNPINTAGGSLTAVGVLTQAAAAACPSNVQQWIEVGHTVSANGGQYSFANLDPTLIYYINFGVAPNYTRSPQNQGVDDTVDSDADINTGDTTCFDVVTPRHDSTIDAGMWTNVAPVGTVTGTEWRDHNGDGLQTPGEPGLAGVTVELHTGNTTVATTTSDVNGNYTFAGVAPGSYTVHSAGNGAGWRFSPKDVGSDDTVDSDVDQSGDSAQFTVTAGSTTDLDVGQYLPALNATKVALNPAVRPGDTITFHFDITNTGDGPLAIAVADPLAPDCVRPTAGNIAPGATLSYTCTMVAPADDFENVAPITGQPPTGPPVTSEPHAPVDVQHPGIHGEKVALTPAVRPGDVITFQFNITNTGDVPLDQVDVVDPLAPDCDRPALGSLAVGQTVTYTCTMVAPQGDFENQATVTGHPPIGPPVTDEPKVPVDVQHPGINASKVPLLTPVRPGDTLTFTITVHNTGDVDLTNVTVVDPLAPGCDHNIGDLAAGATTSYTCTMVAPQSSFTNVATVTGQPPVGPPVTVDAPAPVPVIHPGIDVVKTTNTPVVVAGGVATFQIAVTNTGDIRLTNVTVGDAVSPSCEKSIGDLNPGQTVTYTCDMPISANAVTFENTAVGTGRPDCPPPVGGLDAGAPVNPACEPVTDEGKVPQPVIHPAIHGEKHLVTQNVHPGDTITFEFVVTNTGDAPLSQVNVVDPLAPNCDRPDLGTLAPGASVTYTCTMIAPQGPFENEATVTGHPPVGPPVTDEPKVPVPEVTTISGVIWFDTNQDGIRQTGEPLLPGVTVNLVKSDGTVAAATTTAADGSYAFTNVPYGTYTVKAVPPGAPWVTTPKDQGADDTTDSDLNASFESDSITGDASHVDGGLWAKIDLAVTVHLNDPFADKTTVTWDVTVTNNGPAPAFAPVHLALTLDPTLKFKSITAPGWTCTPTGQTIDCIMNATMNVGNTSTLKVTTDVDGAQPGVAAVLAGTVTANGVQVESTLANNQAQDQGIYQATPTTTTPPANNTPGGGPGGNTPGTGSGPLPFTGSNPLPLVILGLVLISIGSLLMRTRRRFAHQQ